MLHLGGVFDDHVKRINEIIKGVMPWSMTAWTRARVSGRTFSAPVETRETVWAETFAISATSAMEGPRWRRRASA